MSANDRIAVIASCCVDGGRKSVCSTVHNSIDLDACRWCLTDYKRVLRSKPTRVAPLKQPAQERVTRSGLDWYLRAPCDASDKPGHWHARGEKHSGSVATWWGSTIGRCHKTLEVTARTNIGLDRVSTKLRAHPNDNSNLEQLNLMEMSLLTLLTPGGMMFAAETPMDRVIADDLTLCIKNGFPSFMEDTSLFDVLLTYDEELKPHLVSRAFVSSVQVAIRQFVVRMLTDRSFFFLFSSKVRNTCNWYHCPLCGRKIQSRSASVPAWLIQNVVRVIEMLATPRLAQCQTFVRDVVESCILGLKELVNDVPSAVRQLVKINALLIGQWKTYGIMKITLVTGLNTASVQRCSTCCQQKTSRV